MWYFFIPPLVEQKRHGQIRQFRINCACIWRKEIILKDSRTKKPVAIYLKGRKDSVRGGGFESKRGDSILVSTLLAVVTSVINTIVSNII